MSFFTNKKTFIIFINKHVSKISFSAFRFNIFFHLNKWIIFFLEIFFKIDIEGSEYRILDELLKFQSLISGLVIEFHDIDIHREKIVSFIKNFKLNLCHIHGQNPGGDEYLDNNKDPIQIEMTFTRSNEIKSNEPKIPHVLDQPADKRFPEVKLNFEEWVIYF